MKRLVAEAMDQGAIGLGASYSLNHSGWGGVPMPSTISDISEFDALVGAMGGPGRGVVEISSGPIMPDRMEEIAARHGRRIFMSTAVALYNEQYPQRALGVFDACAAAQARGNELYIQITCQPLSFDFTLASAYPFYSHPAFDPIKAYGREQLKSVFRDPSFRESFRADLRDPKPGTVFQGNWERVIVAAPVKPQNAGLADRTIAAIARETGRDPLDVLLDLGLEEDLDTGLIGRFFNAVDDGVEPLVKHRAGVIALSDAGAHLVYLCDAGFGLYFLGHWVRERGAFDLPEGVRRLTSHQAGLYGIPDRGRIAVGTCADLLLFDPATVSISASRRVACRCHLRRDRAGLQPIWRHLLSWPGHHTATTSRLHAPLWRDRIQHLRRTVERTWQPGDRRGLQRHRRRPADRGPPRWRKLAQRYVLRSAAATRDDALCARNPGPVRSGLGGYRICQRRRGLGCLARAAAPATRGSPRGLRLQRPQARLSAQAIGDRPLPAGHPSDHPDAPLHGRKCLYIMRDDCAGIEGIDPEEAEALIAALAEHIVKPAFIYRHQWRPGDLLMWDNCTVQHRAIQDYDLPHRRLMHRTTMGGAVPV